MSNRVNITYSLDVEQLPHEAQRLWNQALKEIKCLNDQPAIPSADSIFSLDSLSQIANTRQQLASVDYLLNDLSKIIQGYMHYQTQPTPSLPTEPAIDELAAKIKEFRSQESVE